MDVYTQAAAIVDLVLVQKGSAKQLCLEKHIQKKKQTYAVVCETVKKIAILDSVIDEVGLMTSVPPETSRGMVRVMCHDLVYAGGIRANKGIAHLLRGNEPAIQRAAISFTNTHPMESVPPQTAPDAEDEVEQLTPKYARINFVIVPPKSGERVAEQLGVPFFDLSNMPDVLMFPPGSQLHAHPMVRRGHLVLQDLASCLSAHALFSVGSRPKVVVDACASPGNKTSHVASLQAYHKIEGALVLAIERDAKRFSVLTDRIGKLGCEGRVMCHHADFLNFTRDDAEAVVVDPSCSGGHEELDPQRVMRLAQMQLTLLTHALTSFPKVRTVVYSTCSRTVAENEGVVASVLATESLQEWSLIKALPAWPERGLVEESAKLTHDLASCCIRVSKPTPFFVAVLSRESALAKSSHVKRQKKRERDV